MQCPSCEHENRDGAKFSRECGSELSIELRCPGCSSLYEAGQKFCDECGHTLTATTPSPTRVAPTAKAVIDYPTSFPDGRSQVKRFLGEGGKKTVYLAYDTTLDRGVAFALIKPVPSANSGQALSAAEGTDGLDVVLPHPHLL